MYTKKVIVSVAYLFVFSLAAIAAYVQKQIFNNNPSIHDNSPFLQGVALCCMSILTLSFYVVIYFIYAWTVTKSQRLLKRYDNFEYHEEQPIRSFYYLNDTPEEHNVNTEIAPSHSFSVKMWNYMYTFGFSVFCASYSIDASNMNASFFFCFGTSLNSTWIYIQEIFLAHPNRQNSCRLLLFTNKRKIKRLFSFIVFLILFINTITFIAWIFPEIFIRWKSRAHYYYYGAANVTASSKLDNQYKNHSDFAVENLYDSNSSSISEKVIIKFIWRELWIEIVAPFVAPFGISAFKNKFHNFEVISGGTRNVLKRGGGDVYFIFALPITCFISMLFLSLYFSIPESSGIQTTLFTAKEYTVWYFILQFIVAPFTLLVSLVIYIGAVGQSEYAMISSSSLCLVFFLYSNFYISIESGHRDMITPCCIMSLVVFLLSLLILVIKVYCNETEVSYTDDVNIIEEGRENDEACQTLDTEEDRKILA